jgi:hypothetical protein
MLKKTIEIMAIQYFMIINYLFGNLIQGTLFFQKKVTAIDCRIKIIVLNLITDLIITLQKTTAF